MNTGRGAHLPPEANWARLIFRCVGLATPVLLHNEPVTFPALPVPNFAAMYLKLPVYVIIEIFFHN